MHTPCFLNVDLKWFGAFQFKSMYDIIRSKVTQLTTDKFRDAQPPQLLLHDYTYLYFIRLVYVQYTC